jgi:hypothetical protein
VTIFNGLENNRLVDGHCLRSVRNSVQHAFTSSGFIPPQMWAQIVIGILTGSLRRHGYGAFPRHTERVDRMEGLGRQRQTWMNKKQELK